MLTSFQQIFEFKLFFGRTNPNYVLDAMEEEDVLNSCISNDAGLLMFERTKQGKVNKIASPVKKGNVEGSPHQCSH